jgi:hypothetical protein
LRGGAGAGRDVEKGSHEGVPVSLERGTAMPGAQAGRALILGSVAAGQAQ